MRSETDLVADVLVVDAPGRGCGEVTGSREFDGGGAAAHAFQCPENSQEDAAFFVLGELASLGRRGRGKRAMDPLPRPTR